MRLSLETTDHWFAVQVFAGREQLCARQILARGYEVFLPCYTEEHRWSDRRRRIQRALFSGYVFCRLTGSVWDRLVTTPGVIRVVGDDRGPVAIANEDIEAIQHVVEAGLHAEPWQFLTAGQRVRIATGPLRGAEGIVVRLQSRHRLILSVSVLQRSVAVEIDPAWISIPPQELHRLSMSR